MPDVCYESSHRDELGLVAAQTRCCCPGATGTGLGETSQHPSRPKEHGGMQGVTEEIPRLLFPPSKTSCYISASKTLSSFRGQLREARQMEEDTNRDAGVLFHLRRKEALQSQRCPRRRILSFDLFC